MEGTTAPTCRSDHGASTRQCCLHPAFLGSPAATRDHMSDWWPREDGGSGGGVPLRGLPKTSLRSSTSSLPSTPKLQDGHGTQGSQLKSEPHRRCCQPGICAPDSAQEQETVSLHSATAHCKLQPVLISTAPQRWLEHLSKIKST